MTNTPEDTGRAARAGKSGVLGPHIKNARTRRQMTLGELASLTSLDKGYLSRVERGLKAPSVSTLLRIAEALEISMSQLFGESVDETEIHVSRAGQRSSDAGDSSTKYSIERLTAGSRRDGLEAFLIFPAEDFPDDHVAEHGGEELLYVVEGEVEVRFADHSVQLGRADSVQFPGHYQHQVRRLSPSATVLVVITRG